MAYEAQCTYTPCCPCCGASLVDIYDHCIRFIRFPTTSDDGEHRRIMILVERRKCPNNDCRRIHRLLPRDDVVPFKQYGREVIQNCLEYANDAEKKNPELGLNRIAEEAIGNYSEQLSKKYNRLLDVEYPCSRTVVNWMLWQEENSGYAQSVLISVGIILLSCMVGRYAAIRLLNKAMSIIDMIKQSFDNWLAAIIFVMVNTGNVPKRVY